MEEKTSKNKKQLVIGVSVLLLVTLLLLGLTYAYYRTKIVGNSGDKSVDLLSKDLEITYQDGNGNISGEEVEPGYNNENNPKEFSVENTGGETAEYSIVFEDITNTFNRREDWTFELKKGEETVKKGTIPKTKSYVLSKVSIDGEGTDNYKLIIRYADLQEVDQSEDMGQTLSFKVNIEGAIEAKMDEAETNTLLAAIGKDNIISEPLTQPGEKLAYKFIDKGSLSSQSYNGPVEESMSVSDNYTFDETTGEYSLGATYSINTSTDRDKLLNKYIACVTLYGPYDKICKITTVPSSGGIYGNSLVAESRELESEFAREEDDYGYSYYYRGNVDNNYVSIGESCWRIVRILGNGNIKIILADENNSCENIDTSDENRHYINKGASISGGYDPWNYLTTSIPSTLDSWIETKGLKDNVNIETEAKWCLANNLIGMSGPDGDLSLKCNFDKEIEDQYKKGWALLDSREAIYAGLVSYKVQGDKKPISWLGYDVSKTNSISSSFVLLDNPIDRPLTSFGLKASPQEGIVDIYQYGETILIRPTLMLKSTTQISSGDGTQANPYKIASVTDRIN